LYPWLLLTSLVHYGVFFWLTLGFLSGLAKSKFAMFLILWSLAISGVFAHSQTTTYPEISFQEFSAFILENFNASVSLSTVLMLLSSLTNNSQLLNLHFHQSAPGKGKYQLKTSAWIKILAHGILEHLGSIAETELFHTSDNQSKAETVLEKKLSDCAKKLGLCSYSENGHYMNLKTISHEAIEPVLVICPLTSFCLTKRCN
jgi:hypothetical protein